MTVRDDGASFYWKAKVTYEGECMGISLRDSADWLLLISERDGYWERVGVVHLSDLKEEFSPGFYSSDLPESWQECRWVVPERRRFRFG